MDDAIIGRLARLGRGIALVAILGVAGCGGDPPGGERTGEQAGPTPVDDGPRDAGEAAIQVDRWRGEVV
ncbi:MAG: hypothetical protein KC457_30175, partial [Myxococcales bacterium]|nr:hypothetical protein [Myxococcales bacterium]